MVVSCDASQFAPGERELIERLLGERLSPGERVLIQRVPAAATTEEDRASARERLLKMIEENRQRALAAGVTEAEAEAAVDEAMEVIRGPGR
jgi:hypothetical protein